ncbi:glycosyltransferase family 2 protein [Candidatus Woesearchaeota archaeon]|nr:glycosyltransferase family 2 protein [Candidatus Woesearchaeota archaeon]
MKPKFSIIVPTRDRPKPIETFLQSLKQSKILERKDLEVIIINNSTKEPPIKSICDAYEVHYLCERKTGKSYALNTGVAHAHGQYLVFTDDDVIVKDYSWIDKLYANFKKNDKIAYVSGNVTAHSIKTDAQRQWEKKGGLSKGNKSKYFSQAYLSTFKLKPWPLTKICAGANCMIKKEPLEEAGGFCTLFGPGGQVGHGESLLIGYELIRRGYELYYEPNAIVHHNHPESETDIKQKLFLYAKGDTAIHMHIFLKYHDFRSLMWAYIGHPTYVTKNMLKYFIGQYALSPKYTFWTVSGSILGPYVYLYKRFLEQKPRGSKNE